MRYGLPLDPSPDRISDSDDDLLGRKKIGASLSKLVGSVSEPLVVALDGKWGTGKSYFLRQWVASRRQSEGQNLTIYFDAFSHDYLSDPLVALVASLSNFLPKEKKATIDEIKRIAGKLARPAARVGLAAAGYGASAVLAGMGEAVVAKLADEADNALENFWRREEGRQVAMSQFRTAIEALTKSAVKDGPVTPLVIVVDELDRCRPDYALEVLEVIKHFFDVSNVHFILGVNFLALQDSVAARYGIGVDSHAYLQKFVSLTIKLPDHISDPMRTKASVHYAEHLGREMELPRRLMEEVVEQIEVFGGGGGISLRQVRKILFSVSALPNEAQSDDLLFGWRVATVTLLISNLVRPDLYQALLSATATNEELVSLFADPPHGDIGINDDWASNIDPRVQVWRVICGHIDSGQGEEWAFAVQAFDRVGIRRDFGKVPQKIYDDWLNVFELS